jgi:hypothetical protein
MNMLILKGETFSLESWWLKQRCELFATNPTLLDSPYHVKSQVRLEVFRLFLEAIKGTSATITNQNFPELSQLCSEFVFTGLANALTAFSISRWFVFKPSLSIEVFEITNKTRNFDEYPPRRQQVRSSPSDNEAPIFPISELRRAEVTVKFVPPRTPPTPPPAVPIPGSTAAIGRGVLVPQQQLPPAAPSSITPPTLPPTAPPDKEERRRKRVPPSRESAVKKLARICSSLPRQQIRSSPADDEEFLSVLRKNPECERVVPQIENPKEEFVISQISIPPEFQPPVPSSATAANGEGKVYFRRETDKKRNFENEAAERLQVARPPLRERLQGVLLPKPPNLCSSLPRQQVRSSAVDDEESLSVNICALPENPLWEIAQTLKAAPTGVQQPPIGAPPKAPPEAKEIVIDEEEEIVIKPLLPDGRGIVVS